MFAAEPVGERPDTTEEPCFFTAAIIEAGSVGDAGIFEALPIADLEVPDLQGIPPEPTPAPDTPPTMEDRIQAEQEENPTAHTWVVAANVPVDTKTARRADFRGSFRALSGMRIDSLEVHCSSCRRPMDDVGDKPCEAKIDNSHLIGGDLSVRAKRIIHEPVGQVIYQPLPSRNGMGGYSVHAPKV